MNVDDLQHVFDDRADEASRAVLDVDAMVRRGSAIRRRRIAGTVLVVVIAVAAGIGLPIALTQATGPSATVTPVASPSGSSNSLPKPSPQVTQIPCAGPFLVGCGGSYPIPTEFVKPVTKAIVDYGGTLDATPQFVVADPTAVAQQFGLNPAKMPAHVYLMQLRGHFACLTCQGPGPGATVPRPTFTYLVAAIAYTPLGPSDTPFFYSASSQATDLTQFGRPF